MADASHLEKMGRELKCPICLSLLNCAVSLTCNHVFCNSCIGKSMKSASDCPVCKVPYRRREIRPAPHMDNLVSIYKNMENASGINIFVSQTAAPTKVSGDMNKPGAGKDNVDDLETQKKCKRKGSNKSSKSSEGRLNSVKPSFPTKKRVQVQKYPPSETPTRPAKSELDNIDIAEKEDQQNLEFQKEKSIIKEKGEAAFSPFFWLREEEDVEKSSQHTDSDNAMDTPPDAPTFSDIKDSDDELPTKLTPEKGTCTVSSNADFFDSEMFEWTQRPCSPELYSSPIKLQVEDSDECGVPQEKIEAGSENRKVIIQEKGTEKVNSSLPSSLNPENKNNGAKKSSKRVRKATKSTQNKRVKTSIDEAPGTHKESPKLNDCNNPDASNSKDNTNEDKELSNANTSLKRKGKSRKKTITQEQSSYAKPNTRKLKASVDGVTSINNEASISDPSHKSPLRNEIKETSDTAIITRNSEVNDNEKRSLKKVKFSEDIKSKDNSDSVVRNNSSETSKTLDHSVLRKCENISSKIICAFCRSAEESEASGVMVHYLKGKPVDNYENGGSVIHSHKNCTEWAPNVYFEGDNVINLESELSRSRRINCSLCGIKGAALGCYEKNCRRSFHVPCAKLTPECRWDYENFVALCPLHASSKLPNEIHEFQAEPKKKRVSKRRVGIDKVGVKLESSTNLTWKSQNKTKDIVICCSALTNEEKEIVSEFERLSKVTLSKNWDSGVTHVIASTDENRACRRTLKFLMGVLKGKWILSIEWIKACMNSGELVDEQNYEIEVDIHGIRNGPKLGRLRLMNQQPKIFNGCKFYFVGDFVASYKGYLHDLVVAAGGTVLNRKPITGEQDNLSTTFVIYSIELPDKCEAKKGNLILSRRKSDADALASSTGAVAASNSWILNSIAGCKLQNHME